MTLLQAGGAPTTHQTGSPLLRPQSTFSPLWGQSFAYNGFGNLIGTSVTQGSAPTLSATYDVNNHAGGEDANGNPGNIYLPADGSSYAATYDVESRLTSTGSGSIFYSYAPGNRRVWRGTGTWVTQGSVGSGSCNTGQWSTDEVTFWGVDGKKLMTYNLVESPNSYYGQCDFSATAGRTDYYFGSRLIKNANGYVYPDRLGSIGKFYPYGIERPSAATNGTEKFTGYFRDSESGNDYAVNRYESPGNGRFLTPDHYQSNSGGPGDPSDPGSWNKHAYTGGDPINRVDPSGRMYCNVDDPSDCVADDVCSDPGQYDSIPGAWLDYCVLGTYIPDGGGSVGGGDSPVSSAPPPANGFAPGPPKAPQIGGPAGLQSVFAYAWNQVWKDLAKPGCDSLFGINPATNAPYTAAELRTKYTDATYNYGYCPPQQGGVPGACTNQSTQTVTINAEGAFNIYLCSGCQGDYCNLVVTFVIGNFKLAANQAMVETILHELAHLTGQGTKIDHDPTLNLDIRADCLGIKTR